MEVLDPIGMEDDDQRHSTTRGWSMETPRSVTTALWAWKPSERGVPFQPIDRPDDPLLEEFNRLARRWEGETLLESSVHRMAMHPDYQRIIGLGPDVVPLILSEMADRPGHWFWALVALTGEDPARETTTIKDATETWLAWGKAQGLR